MNRAFINLSTGISATGLTLDGEAGFERNGACFAGAGVGTEEEVLKETKEYAKGILGAERYDAETELANSSPDSFEQAAATTKLDQINSYLYLLE